MNKTKEYTRDEMLQWLEKHFEVNKYEVKPYSQEFSPARVPLYCIKEGEFKWSKVPGDDDEQLEKLLLKYLDSNLVTNAEINKTKDDKTIIVTGDKSSVTVTLKEKEEKLCIEIKGGRTYSPMVKKKKDKLYIYDEVVVELTTESKISKDDFFPALSIRRENKEVIILEASPVRFYQYYFPKAKIYYAYPDYVEENDEFNKFKKVCIDRGIGLLKTSKKEIEKVVESRSLFDEICEKLVNEKKKHEDIRDIIGDYLENYLHYLVYYPDPIYRRSAIIDKKPGKISRFLIDKMVDCKNIQYASILQELASSYRDKLEDDFDIVLEYIGKLWEDRLGLKYPKIQRHLEEILLRDKMYRDHFVHQFQVFLIGSFVLEKMYDIKGFVKVLKSFEEDYKCKIEDAWLAASTYHDFNYGLQNFDIWLLQFFTDTLSINNEEAKENLNILNLDAAMVRESLSDIITKMVGLLNLDEDSRKKAIKFFYEKSVKDRNHGLLSALSILKLCEIQKDNLKVSFDALLQTALAIACHDEDIWEALCGCKGYLRENNICEGKCDRDLFKNKELAVHKQIISDGCYDRKCEIWEQELMKKSIFQKIKFNNNPLIFLLIYCDAVQEEGRITSMSIGDNPISNYKDFDTKIDNSNFNDWYNVDKRFGEFEQTNKTQANKIKTEFTEHDQEISNEARIYKISKSGNKIWKILDKKILYEIERKKGTKKTLHIIPREKECSLNKIDVSYGNVNIDLIIDGLKEKAKELLRVSWALEDKRFKVHLREKDTIEHKKIEINGSGGR